MTHLESDLHASTDGTVFLFHDETLDRVTNASGKFVERTDAELAEVLAGGQPLCTLDEVLDAFPEAIFNLDVKDDLVIGPLAELIERRGAHEDKSRLPHSKVHAPTRCNTCSQHPSSARRDAGESQ